MVLDIFEVTVAANTKTTVNNSTRFYLSQPNITLNKFAVYGSGGDVSLRDGIEFVIKEAVPVSATFDGDIRKVPDLALASDLGWEVDLNNSTAAAITYKIVLDWEKEVTKQAQAQQIRRF